MLVLVVAGWDKCIHKVNTNKISNAIGQIVWNISLERQFWGVGMSWSSRAPTNLMELTNLLTVYLLIVGCGKSIQSLYIPTAV